ncbi:MAG TPA: tetratricopeptide repeat protein, partial [Phycisphaerae bacterium]|nr:tetratricopeptide repeat protein [Phycisphaerae bacterium]
MTNSTDKQSAPRSPDLAYVFVLGGLLLLPLLHLAAAHTPGITVWGIDYWSDLSWPVRVAAVGLSLLLFVPLIAGAIDQAAGRLRRNWWFLPVAIGAAAVLLYVFRARVLAYGDGYAVLGLYLDGRFPLLYDQLLTHPLDIAVRWLITTFLVQQAGGTAATAGALISVAGGLLSLGAIVRIAGVLAAGRGEVKKFVIAAALTSGAVVLWFGYIEAYTLAQAAGLWTLALAIEVPKNPSRLKWAWALWVVACAFHMLSVVFLPALAWATWDARRGDHGRVGRRTVLLWFLGGLLAGAVGSLILRLRGSSIPVTLRSTVENAYAALSTAHLVDVVNEVLLVAPVAIIAVIVLVLPASSVSSRKDRDQRRDLRGARAILGIAAVTAWYFAFWVDPLLGAFRDWDLLAVFGIPASLWAAAIIVARSSDRRQLGRLWVGVAGVAILHTCGWAAAMQDEMRGALRIDSLVRQDLHYTAAFSDGSRLPSWGFILGDQLNRYDIAVDHFGLKARISPGSSLSWANLGSAYRHLNRFDSSAYCYERALALDPDHPVYLTNIGLLNLWQGNLPAARDAFEREAARSDTNYTVRARLGRVYIDLGLAGPADSILREALAIDPDRPDAYGLLGESAHRLGDTARAIELYETSLAKGSNTEEVYQRLVQLYQWSNRFEEARSAARRWERLFPGSYAAPLLLGTVFTRLEAYDSANAAFTRSATLKP